MSEWNLKETLLDKEDVFDGTLLHVERWRAQLPNGAIATREMIRHVGASAIVPVDEEGNVYLVRQYRAPIARETLELPAGKLDSKAEDRLQAAKRELEEETGLRAKEWVKLADMAAAAAYTDEIVSIYLARGLEKGEAHLDDDEFLRVVKMPLRELCDMAASGKIQDSKTLCGALLAERYIGGEHAIEPENCQ